MAIYRYLYPLILSGNNVGIGVNPPAALFHVGSNTTANGQAIFEQASGDTDSFDVNIRKTRGTIAVPTVITSGDELGVINFRGYSGASGYVSGASIKAFSSGAIADTRIPANLRFYTGTDATPSVLTERMRIDNAGKVGIGTTSPTALLHSNASTGVIPLRGSKGNDAGTTLLLERISGATGSLGIDFNGGFTQIRSVNDIAFYYGSNTAGTEAMRINNAGNVGIGTASPSSVSLLDITSITKGFLPPRMTTAQRTAITAVEGLTIYDLTLHKLMTYDGSTWQALW